MNILVPELLDWISVRALELLRSFTHAADSLRPKARYNEEASNLLLFSGAPCLSD